jgi:hypothetical protein
MKEENNNLKLYNEVREVPEEAIKKITGGRLSGMSDINPMWRIKELTRHFGICGIGWKIEIIRQRLESGANDEVCAFVDINLYIKDRLNDKWSEPIPGIGGASYISKERNGMYNSDECFKMALTDAISVACKLLGFGANVYFSRDTETKYPTYSTATQQPNSKPFQPAQRQQAQQQEPDQTHPFEDAPIDPITPAQLKMLQAKTTALIKNGSNKNWLKEKMEEMTGKSSSKDLSKKEASQFIDWLVKIETGEI